MMATTPYGENHATGDAAGLGVMHRRLVAVDIAHVLDTGCDIILPSIVVPLGDGTRLHVERCERWTGDLCSRDGWDVYHMSDDEGGIYTPIGGSLTLEEAVTRIRLRITPIVVRDVTELQLGDVRASGGGIITHIRFSGSGKTAWITDSTGLVERISANARILVIGDANGQGER